MCDYFDAVETTGPASTEDDFPVNWHPHRGFDICSYLKSGVGRHADSLGNRVTYDTPGMQWMSTGSGVYHAEGGATPQGVRVQGFQIWINVPSDEKMQDPRYGTVPTKDLPATTVAPGVTARLLAGPSPFHDSTGPFETVQPVQMVDFELAPNSQVEFDVPGELDTTMIYVYEGSLSALNNRNQAVAMGHVVLLDATVATERGIRLGTDSSEAKVLLFAGKKLKQPIAWHGPIVMTTDEEISQTLQELRSGAFPWVKVDWDYRKIASKPK